MASADGGRSSHQSDVGPLWRLELNGTSVGTTTSHFIGTFGRMRAIEKIPGINAIWIGTSNADNNGGQPDGSDRILRSNIV